jgi:hypothetical protein
LEFKVSLDEGLSVSGQQRGVQFTLKLLASRSRPRRLKDIQCTGPFLWVVAGRQRVVAAVFSKFFVQITVLSLPSSQSGRKLRRRLGGVQPALRYLSLRSSGRAPISCLKLPVKIMRRMMVCLIPIVQELPIGEGHSKIQEVQVFSQSVTDEEIGTKFNGCPKVIEGWEVPYRLEVSGLWWESRRKP